LIISRWLAIKLNPFVLKNVKSEKYTQPPNKKGILIKL
jgi:hypothetical protein